MVSKLSLSCEENISHAAVPPFKQICLWCHMAAMKQYHQGCARCEAGVMLDCGQTSMVHVKWIGDLIFFIVVLTIGILLRKPVTW